MNRRGRRGAARWKSIREGGLPGRSLESEVWPAWTKLRERSLVPGEGFGPLIPSIFTNKVGEGEEWGKAGPSKPANLVRRYCRSGWDGIAGKTGGESRGNLSILTVEADEGAVGWKSIREGGPPGRS